MQYKTVKVVGLPKSGFFAAAESWETATTRTIMENVQGGWKFVSSFSTSHSQTGFAPNVDVYSNVYLIFEKS
jgi:hypothetical protein